MFFLSRGCFLLVVFVFSCISFFFLSVFFFGSVFFCQVFFVRVCCHGGSVVGREGERGGSVVGRGGRGKEGSVVRRREEEGREGEDLLSEDRGEREGRRRGGRWGCVCVGEGGENAFFCQFLLPGFSFARFFLYQVFFFVRCVCLSGCLELFFTMVVFVLGGGCQHNEVQGHSTTRVGDI